MLDLNLSVLQMMKANQQLLLWMAWRQAAVFSKEIYCTNKVYICRHYVDNRETKGIIEWKRLYSPYHWPYLAKTCLQGLGDYGFQKSFLIMEEILIKLINRLPNWIIF